jgi:hypothetical protein
VPRFRIDREERGILLTTREVEAETREDAEEALFEDDEVTIVTRMFKQHDCDYYNFREVKDESRPKVSEER